MRTLPLAQIGPAKINVALRQVAEAPGIVAAKTLSAVYRNVFGLALTHEASRPLRHRLHHDLHGSTARLPAGRNGPLGARKEAPEGEARV